MRITKTELAEFKQIYFEEFGIKLSDLAATKKALNLLSGVELLATKSSNVLASGGLTSKGGSLK